MKLTYFWCVTNYATSVPVVVTSVLDYRVAQPGSIVTKERLLIIMHEAIKRMVAI